MRKKITLLAGVLLLALPLCAQEDSQEDTLFIQAQKAIDAQEYFRAEKLLKKGLDEGKDAKTYSYELAWTYYCMQEWQKCINVLTPYYKTDCGAEIYQLLGNAYDEKGQSGKANDVYAYGLTLYPDAGCLYLETGNIKMKNTDYAGALYWYEKGIEAEPAFASNYYRAAQIFFKSTEVVWGIMYGEIFMLLERGSERCEAFSKELYEAYASCIHLNYGKAFTDFNTDIIVYSNSYERKNLFPKVYDELMTESCNGKYSISIATLAQIRKSFLDRLYRSHSDFANVLYDYQRSLIQKGCWEAYNYWLFAYADSKASSAWASSHKGQWDSMNKFLKNSPIPITKDNFVSRYTME